MADSTATTHAQQLVFVDDGIDSALRNPSLTSASYDADSDLKAHLGDYLSRPVVIDTFDWDENQSSVFHFFSPWTLYFNNTFIKKKIEHYSRLQCTLKLKFVINASPFYFGMMKACYEPLPSRGLDNTSLDQIPFSQMPHIDLLPQTMTTATMELPFLWPGNWLNVNNVDEFTGMGQMNYVQYAALRSANGVSSGGITITCYAWAENVQVAGPTAALALQGDEYEESGTVSGPATMVAEVAARLSDVPVIGVFARATELGARAVSGIARLFGYSNPPIIDDVVPMQNKAFHAFANTETSMPLDKLCLDPKNEVTIDNTVAGTCSDDELALANFITRPSFLQGTLWSSANTPGTLLWSASVTPTPDLSVAETNQSRQYHTPLSYAGRMFRFWRGSIVYKIKIVKTKYHTGRLVISWDPLEQAAATSDVQTTCFTRLVDIQVEDEVEIVIPYKATTPWLLADFSTGTFSNGPAPTLTYSDLLHNGTLTVRVQNVLTGPAALPEIDILVHTYAGKDFQYSVPKELPQHSPYSVQSEETVMSDQPISNDLHVAAITTGESVASLRPLLHRASYWKTEVLGQTLTAAATYVGTGTQFTTNLLPRVPTPWGYDTSNALHWGVGIVVPATSFPFSYVQSHPIDWVMNCFVGYRGSTNLHINPQSNSTTSNVVESLSASRSPSSTILNATLQNRNRFTLTVNPGNASGLARTSVTSTSNVVRKPSGQTGLSLTNARTQAALSVNVPQYSKFRFRQAYAPVRDRYPPGGAYEYDNVRVSATFATNVTSSSMQWPLVDLYYSAGVDFNPVFFVCTPRLYSYGNPNAVDTYTP